MQISPRSPLTPGRRDVEFSYNSQDQVVLPPATTTLHGVLPDGSTDQLRLADSLTPNPQGAYVYSSSDLRYHAANAFASVGRAVETMQSVLPAPIHWSTPKDKLEVHPDQGKTLNAYYNRDKSGVFFFHSVDPKTRQTVWGADSGEVTAHEGGHAILDAVRPGYFQSWAPETAGFHESFGDVVAMLTSLQDPRMVAKLAEQTGGDLGKPNALAAMGEEFGITINHTVGNNATGGDYTRTALNDFVYEDPFDLPDQAPPNQLSREPHSISRLWTGATYDLVAALVKDHMAHGASASEAIRQAGQETLEMYGRLLQKAPQGEFTYPEMAAAFVKSDRELNQGKRAGLLTQVFTQRKILNPGVAPQEVPQGSHRVRVTLQEPGFGPFAGAQVEALMSGERGFVDGETARVKNQLAHLIQAGEILYTPPGQTLTEDQLFKADGNPYTGVARWEGDQLLIERVPILA